MYGSVGPVRSVNYTLPIDPNRSKGIVLQSRRTVLFLVKVKPFFILTAVAARSTGSVKVPALDEIE